jgi:hypothetical protein
MQVRPSPTRPWSHLLALTPALFCVACSQGPKLNPVEGKVVYRDKPLAGAVVTFHLKGGDAIKDTPPVGLTKEDGTFTVTTGQKPGAQAGDYVVTVVAPAPTKERKEGVITMEPPDTRDRLNGAYADKGRSKLKAQITDGPNQLEPFVLK